MAGATRWSPLPNYGITFVPVGLTRSEGGVRIRLGDLGRGESPSEGLLSSSQPTRGGGGGLTRNACRVV